MEIQTINETVGELIGKRKCSELNCFFKDLLCDNNLGEEEKNKILQKYKPRIKNLLHDIEKSIRRIPKKESKSAKHTKLMEDSRNLNEIILIMENAEEKGYSGYDYIFDILINIRDMNSYKVIIRDYPQLINPLDEEGKSLFENVLDEFNEVVKKKDRLYLMQVIALILEKDGFNRRNIDAINSFMENNDMQRDSYRELLRFFDHCFKKYNRNDHSIPKAKSKYDENIIQSDYRGYNGILNVRDLSMMDTFTVDSDNLIAYSIEEIKDYTRVYVHVVDLHEYLEDDSDELEYAESGMFGKLFDKKKKKKHVSFTKDKNRFALTGVFTFDKYGKKKDFQLCRSVISVNSENEKDRSKKNRIKKLFHIEGKNFKREMSNILNFETYELLKTRNIPLIFKNLYEINDMKKTLANSDVSKLTRENLKKYLHEQRNILMKCCNGRDCVSFSTLDDGSLTKVEITDPLHSFPVLVNQAMIKKYFIDGYFDKEEMNQDRDYAEAIIAAANAANKKTGTNIECFEIPTILRRI